ncbi:MAG: hypothetical protein HY736_26675 [Verrucomicrobia bacterium]|nr:hypothetical protein [Verrucomicrobiota bacterium]
MKPQLVRGSLVLVIVLLLVLDRRDYEHDYEQEHEGSFGLPASRGVRLCAAEGNIRLMARRD